MRAWMIYREPDAYHNRYYIKAYQEKAKKYGIDIQLVYADLLHFGIRDNSLYVTYEKKPIDLPDFAIQRINYTILTRHLETMGVKVFNNSNVSEICNDKSRTFQYLSHLNIPMIPTIFCKYEFVAWNLRNSKEDRVVVKAVDGHGGNQVFLYRPGIDGEKERIIIIKKLNGSDAVLQPFYRTGNHDVRVFIIGKEIVASIMRTSHHDFRSNYSLGGKARPYTLSKEEEKLVNRIVGEFDFGMVGIDFLLDDEGGLVLNEIEDVVGARMLYDCYDIDLADLYLKFILESMNDRNHGTTDGGLV